MIKMSEFTQTNDSAASGKNSFYLQSSLLLVGFPISVYKTA
jgi:hypothetical protein